MDKLNEILLNGIDKYFSHLSNFGQTNKNQEDSLLILMFIKQITETSMNIYITQEDYRIMEKVLYCLIGKSCLLDYNSFKEGSSVLNDISLNDSFKLLEINDIRFTESSIRFQDL